MRKEIEKLGIITEEISDENVDFSQGEPVEDDGEVVLHSVEVP